MFQYLSILCLLFLFVEMVHFFSNSGLPDGYNDSIHAIFKHTLYKYQIFRIESLAYLFTFEVQNKDLLFTH